MTAHSGAPRSGRGESTTQCHRRGARSSRYRLTGGGIATALLGWAMLQEARKPAAERHWTGALAGIFPYDLRRPSVARFRARMWAPDDPRIIMPRVFGVGWTLNFGRLARLLRSCQRDNGQRSNGA